jgi:AraC-like DNA-binding protein
MYFSACETDYSIRGVPPFSAACGDISYVPQSADYTCRFKNCTLNKQRCNEYLINFELFDETGQPFALAEQVKVIRPRDHIWYARRFEEVLQLFHHSSAPKGQIKALVYSILTDLSLEQRKEHLSAGKYARSLPACSTWRSISGRIRLCRTWPAVPYQRIQFSPPVPRLYRPGAAGLRRQAADRQGQAAFGKRGMSVAEAAEAVGYQDSSYFSRVFKLKTGYAEGCLEERGIGKCVKKIQSSIHSC